MKLRSINVKKFRGITDQSINGIHNALVLIGKNNSGKSAFLTAIRAFLGDYNPQPKDFYKNSDIIEITAVFEVDDDYLSKFFTDKKWGIQKIPANVNDFDSIKENTDFADFAFNAFKNERKDAVDNHLDDISTRTRFEIIWLKAIKAKLEIDNRHLTIKAVFRKGNSKVEYFINDSANGDVAKLFPNVAFIDDTRYFEEEETGKAKTITSSLFAEVLKNQAFQDDTFISCENCRYTDCDIRCIDTLRGKNPADLSIQELQKLINYKTNNSSEEITQRITDSFQKNYQEGFKVNIKATSNVDKSFSLTTRIYDPNLDSEIELSNVGAGVRSIYILSLLQSYQQLSSNNTILLFEEPELYLHPELQKEMAKTLSHISDNSQIMFTTHSPIMLREFCNEDIRKVSLDDEYSCVATTTSIDEVLAEIGFSTQDIINTDFIIFVEGIQDIAVVKSLLIKYYNVNIERITIIDTDSCKSIGFFATLKFLEKTTIDRDFAIICDADTRIEEKVISDLTNQLTGMQLIVTFPITTIKKLITEFSSIEGYLFSPDLLVQKHIYNDNEEVYTRIKEKLIRNKTKCVRYFRNHNQDYPERVESFENEYETKVENPQENLDWIKKNIRGHFLFEFTQSEQIPYKDYVEELPITAFADIIRFFDGMDYFSDKKNHEDL